MNEELIEKLRNGELAVQKDVNNEEMLEFLDYAFPNDSSSIDSKECAIKNHSTFEASSLTKKKWWNYNLSSNKELVKASEILHTPALPKLGDVVFVRDEDDKPWNPYVFVLDRGEGFEYRYGTCDNILDKENEQVVVTIEFYRQMSIANQNEITIEEAEEKFNIKIKR